MAVLATDDFNRADSADLGANWNPGIGPMQILSNKATWGSAAGDGSDAGENYSAISWPDDQYGQVAISGQDTTGSGSGIGIMLRYANSSNYYRIVVSGDAANNVVVAKVVSGGFTQITTRTQAWTNGDILKVEVQGNTLKVFRNGVQLGANITGDAALATGGVGMFYSSSANTIRADDFEGGDFSTASTGLAWIRA